MLPEAVAADIDYDQILVPIVGSRITDEMIVLACQLATEKESSIDALYVIEVPMNLPLDARLVKERARAQGVLTAAAAIANQFGVLMRPHVITARGAGPGDRATSPRSASREVDHHRLRAQAAYRRIRVWQHGQLRAAARAV